MPDIENPAMDRRSEPIAVCDHDDATEPVLVMRPESFFSLRFNLRTARRRQAPDGLADAPVAPERRIDFTLLLLILLMGVPLLVYCVLSAGR